MMQTNFAVYIGIVYSYLPFMILPLYTNLVKMDLTLLEAAADLGCRPWKSFLQITLPLSLPGIIAGCMLVFIPAVGEFVIPSLLGDPGMLMIGKVLWTEFFNNRYWPVASAVAIALLMFLVIPIMIYQYCQASGAEGRTMKPGASLVPHRRADPGLCIPLHADRARSSFSPSTSPAGHRLGRLLDASGTAS